MSVRKRDITKTVALIVVLAFFSIGLLSRCASVAAPQGGPKDSLPPKVVAMTPAYGTTNFKGKRIYIEFDEYVQLKDQQKTFGRVAGQRGADRSAGGSRFEPYLCIELRIQRL